MRRNLFKSLKCFHHFATPTLVDAKVSLSVSEDYPFFLHEAYSNTVSKVLILNYKKKFEKNLKIDSDIYLQFASYSTRKMSFEPIFCNISLGNYFVTFPGNSTDLK